MEYTRQRRLGKKEDAMLFQGRFLTKAIEIPSSFSSPARQPTSDFNSMPVLASAG
jgi:hypothetical protein